MSELASQVSINPDPNAGGQQQPAQPAVEPEPEGTTDVGGSRMVPLPTLIEERRQRQALAREVEQLRAVKANWDIVEPFVPDLAEYVANRGKKAAPPPPPAAAQDPELNDIVRTFGFYDQDGQPDYDRAAAARTFMDKRAGSVAAEAVRPVAHNAASTQARLLRDNAYHATDKAGRPFAARDAIDRVLDNLSPEDQANPQVVATALFVARGMSAPAAGEPLHTEGGSGGNRQGATLSSPERAAARARGLSDEQWIKTRDSGDSNVLE